MYVPLSHSTASLIPQPSSSFILVSRSGPTDMVLCFGEHLRTHNCTRSLGDFCLWKSLWCSVDSKLKLHCCTYSCYSENENEGCILLYFIQWQIFPSNVGGSFLKQMVIAETSRENGRHDLLWHPGTVQTCTVLYLCKQFLNSIAHVLICKQHQLALTILPTHTCKSGS